MNMKPVLSSQESPKLEEEVVENGVGQRPETREMAVACVVAWAENCC